MNFFLLKVVLFKHFVDLCHEVGEFLLFVEPGARYYASFFPPCGNAAFKIGDCVSGSGKLPGGISAAYT